MYKIGHFLIEDDPYIRILLIYNLLTDVPTIYYVFIYLF